MSKNDFQVRVVLPVSPEQAMAGVECPEAWWSVDAVGSVRELGDTFHFHYQDMHRSVQKVVEKIPGRRSVWEVTESHLSFLKNKSEWTGTRLVFEALPHTDGCELVFTHEGLNPSLECYNDCVGGWTYYVTESLPALVTTGTGKPEEAS